MFTYVFHRHEIPAIILTILQHFLAVYAFYNYSTAFPFTEKWRAVRGVLWLFVVGFALRWCRQCRGRAKFKREMTYAGSVFWGARQGKRNERKRRRLFTCSSVL